MFQRLLLIACATCLALPARANGVEIPPGWSHDRTYSAAGIEVLASPDKKITVIIGPTQPPSAADLSQWLAAVVAQMTKGRTIIEDAAKQPSPYGKHAIASHSVVIRGDDGHPEKLEIIAKRMTRAEPIQLVRISTKAGAEPIESMATLLIVLSVDLPFIDNATREKVIESVKEREQAEVKTVAEPTTKPQARYRTAPGEGIADGALLRMGHDFGTTKFDHYKGRLVRSGVETWILLRDGTAYRFEGLPPADFDTERSRAEQPDRWRDGSTLKTLTWFEPREPNTRVALSLRSPRVTGSRTSPRTETRYLTLYEDGRFDTARVSFSRSSMAATENSTFTSSSSDKHGSTSSYSGITDAGNAAVAAQSVQRQRDINPARMGSYTIDGLTIELRFDDGRVQRRLFGFDGDGHAVFDGEHYFE